MGRYPAKWCYNDHPTIPAKLERACNLRNHVVLRTYSVCIFEYANFSVLRGQRHTWGVGIVMLNKPVIPVGFDGKHWTRASIVGL